MKDYKLIGFSVDNFRIFSNETNFELKPITVLTGKNSSGKSSFIKGLKLLTNSYKKNGLVKLDVMDSKLKFGGFQSIKNFKQDKDEISFGIKIAVNEKDILDIRLVFCEKYLTSLAIYNESAELLLQRKIKFENASEVRERGKFNINNFVEEGLVSESYIKIPDTVINKDILKKSLPDLPDVLFTKICNSILNFLQTSMEAHCCNNEKWISIMDHNINDIIEWNYSQIMKGLEAIGKLEKSKIVKFDHGNFTPDNSMIPVSTNPQFKDFLPSEILDIFDDQLKNEFLSRFLFLESFKDLNILPVDIFKELFNRFEFIEGVRATQEIVFTKEQSPLFYKLFDAYYNYYLPIDYMDIEKWVIRDFKLLQLPEGKYFHEIFKIEQIPGYGYLLKIEKDNKIIGLADLGYGVTQLLPILLKIGLLTEAIFIIEEPESNLHPALQSKLADLFSEAIKPLNFTFQPRQFIIETHSEYLIRKLQYLTAKGDIDKDQTQLFYFNNPEDIETSDEQITKININKDGSLTDNFGAGFFDQADNIALDLFLLNQSQKN